MGNIQEELVKIEEKYTREAKELKEQYELYKHKTKRKYKDRAKEAE